MVDLFLNFYGDLHSLPILYTLHSIDEVTSIVYDTIKYRAPQSLRRLVAGSTFHLFTILMKGAFFRSENHARYRITLVFEEDNLSASGIYAVKNGVSFPVEDRIEDTPFIVPYVI